MVSLNREPEGHQRSGGSVTGSMSGWSSSVDSRLRHITKKSPNRPPRRVERRQQGMPSDDRCDPPINTKSSKTSRSRQQVRSQDPPPRTRRVNFANQLEIHAKQIPPQLPGTPTIPILRTGLRGRRPTPYKAQDPTPRSNERPDFSRHSKPSRAQMEREVDPPIDGSTELIYSPLANQNLFSTIDRQRGKFNDMELNPRRDWSSAANDDNSWNVANLFPAAPNSRKVVGPSPRMISADLHTPPRLTRSAPRSAPLQKSGRRKLVEKRRPQSVPKKGSARQPNLERPRRGLIFNRSRNESQDSAISIEQHEIEQLQRPLQDLSDKRGAITSESYPNEWRRIVDSPSTASSESQSAYLIHRFPKEVSGTIDWNKTYEPPGKENLHVNIPPSGSYMDHSGSKSTVKTQNLYSQLGDNVCERMVGTEVVLVPGIPKQIEMCQDNSEGLSESRHQRKKPGIGRLLRRPMLSSPKVPFLELPVVMSFDDNAILKKSTGSTDSDSGLGYNAKPDIWNKFDHDDRKEYSFLRSRGPGCRRMWKFIFMLVCLVVLCLSIGLPVYFRMTGSPRQAPTTVQTSLCATSNMKETGFSERYSSIRKFLMATLEETEAAALFEPRTPQREALCWIADFDDRKVGINKGNIPALVQRYTMGVFYYSMIDESEEDTSSLKYSDFLSSAHECDWGVTMCNEDQTVTALLLADKVLRGSLTPSIGNLLELSFLELSLNQISGPLPTEIGLLSKLEYFAIAFNELTGSIPTEIGDMEKLEFLNMRSSEIVGTIPTELGRLAVLETLLLEGNWLSGTIPSEIGTLHSAEQMSFKKNYLSGKVSNDICELRGGLLEDLKVDSWIECDCCTT